MKRILIGLILLGLVYLGFNHLKDGLPNKVLSEKIFGYSDDEGYLVPSINTIGSNVKSSFTITNFSAVLNAALKSTKEDPLWQKPGHSSRIWSRGNSRLISVKNNTITFETDLYYRKNVLGVWVTKHHVVVANSNMALNNKKNTLDLRFNVGNIRGIPGQIEQWFNLSKDMVASIPIPTDLLKYKDRNKKITFVASKPKDNQLKVEINLPLNSSALAVFSK